MKIIKVYKWVLVKRAKIERKAWSRSREKMKRGEKKIIIDILFHHLPMLMSFFFAKHFSRTNFWETDPLTTTPHTTSNHFHSKCLWTRCYLFAQACNYPNFEISLNKFSLSPYTFFFKKPSNPLTFKKFTFR